MAMADPPERATVRLEAQAKRRAPVERAERAAPPEGPVLTGGIRAAAGGDNGSGDAGAAGTSGDGGSSNADGGGPATAGSGGSGDDGAAVAAATGVALPLVHKAPLEDECDECSTPV